MLSSPVALFLKRSAVVLRRSIIITASDTLALARTRHPGAKHSLDALCVRFGIDRSHRVKHGALLDAQLLAQVYVELTGGRQIGLGLVAESSPSLPPERLALPRHIRAKLVRRDRTTPRWRSLPSIGHSLPGS